MFQTAEVPEACSGPTRRWEWNADQTHRDVAEGRGQAQEKSDF